MAIYHLSAQIIGRSQARSAVAAAAYRAGEKVRENETREIHDYRKKGGVRESGIETPEAAPDWAKDRAKLWNSVHEKETRKNSRLAREFNIALPSELSPDAQKKLVQDFAREEFAARGIAADWAIHEPNKAGDERNVHAHIMTTTRKLDRSGWTEKDRESDSREWLEAIRQSWEKRVNLELERAGIEERIDCRTLEAQGIDREPQQHMGVVATAIERKGKRADKRREAASQGEEKPREITAEELYKIEHRLDVLDVGLESIDDPKKAVDFLNQIDQEEKQAKTANILETTKTIIQERTKNLEAQKDRLNLKWMEEQRAAPEEPKRGLFGGKRYEEEKAKFEAWQKNHRGTWNSYEATAEKLDRYEGARVLEGRELADWLQKEAVNDPSFRSELERRAAALDREDGRLHHVRDFKDMVQEIREAQRNEQERGRERSRDRGGMER